MSSFGMLLRNENMKIYRRPRTWAMVGILILALMLLAGLMKWDESSSQDSAANWKQNLMQDNEHMQQSLKEQAADSSPEMKQMMEERILLNEYAIEHDINPNENSLWSIVNASSMLIVLVTLLTVVIAADMVAAEFSWGTIKLLLVGPASRSKVLLSKYAASLLFALFLLVVNFAVSFALGAGLEGMDGLSQPLLTVGADGAVHEGSMLLDSLQRYGFSIVQLIMYVTMAFMISASFRSSSMAIAFSLLFILAGNTLVNILARYEWVKYLMFANVDLSQYVSGTPIRPEMTLTFSIGILVAYYALFHFITWIMFTKRDVAG
ncbi:ABC transporter permease [Paenibacillus mendelii]|uniref:ABC transporter permease n=1 Tax=Paenibacillus mendelii TaxID=206163 RepID=A0ABV6J378_9BACL|nr:ABC transporter permease [Paenibacillus mendelii]MCQ6559439.1 ABC transporter permease [Paenibacillus mendelii]